MKKILSVGFILLLLLSNPTFAEPSKAFNEINANFTYNNKPIHPGLIEEFANWIPQERPPIINTINVAAAFDTEQFKREVFENDEGWKFIDTGKVSSTKESFGYRWLGRMDNGLHVIETAVNTGGTGTYMDVLFLRFSESEFLLEQKDVPQILMTVVRSFALGDRYDGQIVVHPDKVMIPASANKTIKQKVKEDIELIF